MAVRLVAGYPCLDWLFSSRMPSGASQMLRRDLLITEVGSGAGCPVLQYGEG